MAKNMPRYGLGIPKDTLINGFEFYDFTLQYHIKYFLKYMLYYNSGSIL